MNAACLNMHSMEQNAQQRIVELCQPLAKFDISFFNYVRLFPDHSKLVLGNNPAWINNFVDAKLYEFALLGEYDFPEKLSMDFVTLLSIGLPYIPEIHQAFFEYDIGDCIVLMEKSEKYTEYFYFAVTRSIQDPSINNFYINNIHLFKEYTGYFKENAGILIQEQQKLCVPPPNKINPHNKLTANTVFDKSTTMDFYNKIQLSTTNVELKTIRFSRRELQCIKGLFDGNSAREIGEKLNLSSRTIEYYIGNIKQKTKCRKKSELIATLLKMQLSLPNEL